MTISGLTNSTILPVQKTTSSQATESAPAQDQASFNMSANTFSSLVKEAAQMPEVRSDVVETYQARIAAGHYPAQDIIAGLTRLIGGHVSHSAQSDSSAS
jgi:hypothetical protein